MTKWEYKILEVKRSMWRLPWYHPPLKLKMDGKLLHEKIDELGSEGWELVPLTFEEEEIFRPGPNVRTPGRREKFIHLKYVTFKRPRHFTRNDGG